MLHQLLIKFLNLSYLFTYWRVFSGSFSFFIKSNEMNWVFFFGGGVTVKEKGGKEGEEKNCSNHKTFLLFRCLVDSSEFVISFYDRMSFVLWLLKTFWKRTTGKNLVKIWKRNEKEKKKEKGYWNLEKKS